MTPRGGHVINRSHIGGVTVTHHMARIEDMPRCAACSRVHCSHSDPVFQGIIPPAGSDQPPVDASSPGGVSNAPPGVF